jgi:hypothetical protein
MEIVSVLLGHMKMVITKQSHGKLIQIKVGEELGG